MSISGSDNVRIAEAAFGHLSSDEKLYPFAASTFRDRWDRIIVALKIPDRLLFAPGGLRGGGAVAAYLNDEGIDNLMWKMRVRDQVTLAHYLQEVTAISSLRD